jgi:hypothetical protein
MLPHRRFDGIDLLIAQTHGETAEARAWGTRAIYHRVFGAAAKRVSARH